MSKWTKRGPHTSLGFIKVDLEAKVGTYNKMFSPAIDPSVGTGIEIGKTTTGATMGPTTGTDLQIIIDVTVGKIAIGLMKDGLIIGKTIGEKISGKTTETDKIIEGMTPDKDTWIGVRVEIDQEIIVATILEAVTGTEMDACNKELELCQMTEKVPGPGLIQE